MFIQVVIRDNQQFDKNRHSAHWGIYFTNHRNLVTTLNDSCQLEMASISASMQVSAAISACIPAVMSQ